MKNHKWPSHSQLNSVLKNDIIIMDNSLKRQKINKGGLFDKQKTSKTPKRNLGVVITACDNSQTTITSQNCQMERYSDVLLSPMINILDSLERRMDCLKQDVDKLRDHNLYSKTPFSEKAFSKVHREIWQARHDFRLLRD